MYHFPEKLLQNATKTVDGAKWLKNLDKVIAEIAEKWGLTPDKPLLNLSYNFVAPTMCSNNKFVILKLRISSLEH